MGDSSSCFLEDFAGRESLLAQEPGSLQPLGGAVLRVDSVEPLVHGDGARIGQERFLGANGVVVEAVLRRAAGWIARHP